MCVILYKSRSDFFCASFRSGFCFSMKSWNVARCTIRVSSFCEILFVFLQQILDFQFIQNNTHLASGFPVIFCQMVLWFQIRIIFLKTKSWSKRCTKKIWPCSFQQKILAKFEHLLLILHIKKIWCLFHVKKNLVWLKNIAPLTWVGFELTSLVVIGTDCKSSYKPNYHMIMTTTASI
jgi:hypothetical protein